MGPDFTVPGYEMDETFQTLRLRVVNENRMMRKQVHISQIVLIKVYNVMFLFVILSCKFKALNILISSFIMPNLIYMHIYTYFSQLFYVTPLSYKHIYICICIFKNGIYVHSRDWFIYTFLSFCLSVCVHTCVTFLSLSRLMTVFEKSNKFVWNKSPQHVRQRRIRFEKVGDVVNGFVVYAFFGLMTSWEELIVIKPQLLINPQEMPCVKVIIASIS